MEKIVHKTVSLNGINLHFASAGYDGAPVVLLLHGFPELWYMWRHQMLFLASRGYRAIAPDLRGYGDSDILPHPSSAATLQISGDLVALLDFISVQRAFLVGHDFGAYHGWNLCLFRPDRVASFIALSVPFFRRDPVTDIVSGCRAIMGDDFYMCRFQEPGNAEEEFGRYDAVTLMKKLFTMFGKPGALLLKETGSGWLRNEAVNTPPWLSEQDIEYYASKFRKTGFTGALNHYRALRANWEHMAAWSDAKVKVPTKLVIGEMDLLYSMPSVKDYIHSGGLIRDVPLLNEVVIMKGAAHFINEEKPDEINAIIDTFFRSFSKI